MQIPPVTVVLAIFLDDDQTDLEKLADIATLSNIVISTIRKGGVVRLEIMRFDNEPEPDDLENASWSWLRRRLIAELIEQEIHNERLSFVSGDWDILFFDSARQPAEK